MAGLMWIGSEDWQTRLRLYGAKRVLGRALMATALAVGSLGLQSPIAEAHGTHVCSPFEVGSPYRPAGTSVIRAWGDARCSRNVHELQVWLRIFRSTDGGNSYYSWADGPWDANGIPPHCNGCSYKAATLQKSCAGTGTAKYFASVYVRYFDTVDMQWHGIMSRTSDTRQITC
jgi:hypothetical protein